MPLQNPNPSFEQEALPQNGFNQNKTKKQLGFRINYVNLKVGFELNDRWQKFMTLRNAQNTPLVNTTVIASPYLNFSFS